MWLSFLACAWEPGTSTIAFFSYRLSRPRPGHGHGHTATRPPGHPATRPPGHPATRPPGHGHGHPATTASATTATATSSHGHPATRPPGHRPPGHGHGHGQPASRPAGHGHTVVSQSGIGLALDPRNLHVLLVLRALLFQAACPLLMPRPSCCQACTQHDLDATSPKRSILWLWWILTWNMDSQVPFFSIMVARISCWFLVLMLILPNRLQSETTSEILLSAELPMCPRSWCW